MIFLRSAGRHPSATLFLGVGLLLGSQVGQAQTTFSVGPRVGYNLSTVRYRKDDLAASSAVADASYRSGVEAGLVANIGFGRVALQPAVLYSQKGYKLYGQAFSAGANYLYQSNTTYRFDYISLPLNVVVSMKATGQGLQLLAGPYLGLLAGGHYSYADQYTYSAGQVIAGQGEGRVKAGDSFMFSSTPPDNSFYSRRLDVGLQAGLGYRHQAFQLQAIYSLGLRNIGATLPGFSNSPIYQNQAFQAALSYLVATTR